jgi:hypothetical protein
VRAVPSFWRPLARQPAGLGLCNRHAPHWAQPAAPPLPPSLPCRHAAVEPGQGRSDFKEALAVAAAVLVGDRAAGAAKRIVLLSNLCWPVGVGERGWREGWHSSVQGGAPLPTHARKCWLPATLVPPSAHPAPPPPPPTSLWLLRFNLFTRSSPQAQEDPDDALSSCLAEGLQQREIALEVLHLDDPGGCSVEQGNEPIFSCTSQAPLRASPLSASLFLAAVGRAASALRQAAAGGQLRSLRCAASKPQQRVWVVPASPACGRRRGRTPIVVLLLLQAMMSGTSRTRCTTSTSWPPSARR